MALTPFDMEGVNRDLLAAGNPTKPDMQSILRRNARDLVLGNAILVSSVDARELEFGVHLTHSDADGGFDTDPREDVQFEASSLPIPNERPDLPPDNALRIRVTDVLTEYGFTDIDVKAPDRTPEGIWIGFEAMQPVRLDVTSAQGGRSVSLTLTAAEANDWRSGRLDAHGRRTCSRQTGRHRDPRIRGSVVSAGGDVRRFGKTARASCQSRARHVRHRP